MSLESLLEQHDWLLMEAAVVESLRRSPSVELHPLLANAPLVWEKKGRAALLELYFGFIEVAREANVPLILSAPTWRANRERMEAAGMENDLNGDAARFMQAVRKATEAFAPKIAIGGLLGCKNDCYLPQESLPAAEARSFHSWQVERLAEANVDFLHATTLPAVEEAKGIAAAMAETEVPYLLSFVINRQGHILDGTPLADAFDEIDGSTARPPVGYAINCSYPTFLTAADLPKTAQTRLLGFQANASNLDHCELEGAESLLAEPVAEWGDHIIALHREIGVKMLGGCCGTDLEHLKYLIKHLAR